MIHRAKITAAAVGILLAATACGPDNTTEGTSQTASPAASVQQSTSDTSVSADAVCGLLTLAEMGQATGYTFTATEADMSGNVSACHYIGAGPDGYSSSKTIIEYNPTGLSALDYTKANGTAVDGFDNEAYYFSTSGELEVALTGTAVFIVFIQDARVHNNDPLAAATEMAHIAVPKLLDR
jgi:hypothetical protein